MLSSATAADQTTIHGNRQARAHHKPVPAQISPNIYTQARCSHCVLTEPSGREHGDLFRLNRGEGSMKRWTCLFYWASECNSKEIFGKCLNSWFKPFREFLGKTASQKSLFLQIECDDLIHQLSDGAHSCLKTYEQTNKCILFFRGLSFCRCELMTRLNLWFSFRELKDRKLAITQQLSKLLHNMYRQQSTQWHHIVEN